MAYRYVHLCFAGFTQRLGREGNGVHRLFDELYARYASPETLVEYGQWFCGPDDLAERLKDLDHDCRVQHGHRIKIQLIGYSFGGQTAVRVADKCWPGLIDLMDLCDPVARRGRLGWLAAANPLATIRVPSNVRSLTWIQQRNPRWQCRRPFFWPAGHDIKCSPETDLEGPIDLTAFHSHLTIDNSGSFRHRVLDRAARLHGYYDRDDAPDARVIPIRKAA